MIRNGGRKCGLAWLALSCAISAMGRAQPYWAIAMGEGEESGFNDVQRTSDGGYIIAAYTVVEDLGVAWVVKLDADGAISWQKQYDVPGESDSEGAAIRQTTDGGYLLGLSTDDFGLLKLDSRGNVQWQKTYGGAGYDRLDSMSMVATGDGGCVLTGHTDSFHFGDREAFAVGLSSDGRVEWANSRWTNEDEPLYPVSVATAADGAYGMVTRARDGDYQVWFTRLDSSGATTDEHLFGSEDDEHPKTIDTASDGGWFVAGALQNGDDWDAFCMKLTSNGTPVWQISVGDDEADGFAHGMSTADGGYLAVGWTWSAGNGESDLLIVKFDSAGRIDWHKTYGAADREGASGIDKDTDDGFIVVGWTYSHGGMKGLALHVSSRGEISTTTCRDYVQTSRFTATTLDIRELTGFSPAVDNVGPTTGLPEFLAMNAAAEITPICRSSCQLSCSATVPPSGIPGIAEDFTGSATLVECGDVTVSYSWSFGDGSTSTDQNPSHAYLAPGDYGWVLTVTAPGASPCVQSGTILISEMVQQADLTGAWTSINMKKNQVSATLSCQNIGPGNAGSFTIAIYSSKKPTISKKSKLIKTETVSSLAAGGSVSVSLKTTLQNKYKYLIALVDSDETVAESNEANNTIVGSVP